MTESEERSGARRVWSAPGRVNLIGEHTDYNDGFVLPIAIPLAVTCRGVRHADELVRVRSRQRPGEPVRLPAADLAAERDRVPGWARYPLGVLTEFGRRGHRIEGLDLEFDGDVPAGAGLSSSAALCCAAAVALRDLCAPATGDRELIDIARAAENDYVGAPTGILDHAASILCTAGHALFLDVRAFQSAETGGFEQLPFDLAATGLRLLVIDTGQTHEHAGGEYAARRAECAEAAAALGVGSLRDIGGVDQLTGLDDPVLYRRAHHVVSENERVRRVAELLREGADPRAIGPLLSEGHTSLRDDFAVSTEVLDTAVDTAQEAGAHGSRMVGGGFGGSIIALVDTADAERVGSAVRQRLAEMGYDRSRTFEAVAGPGAGPVV
ncbi:galactokinase [Nocardia speluncae]|uniref:Galactokinase n=1 Tax=Nocardia speluncae TaxID=419477 RepID=A0A846XEV6_9NOCA|nr:galactokinase [Nocardia speluncae]NKY33947.1 galactokinase [Nocardia speluncae]